MGKGKGKKKGKGNEDQPSEAGGGPSGGASAQPQRQPAQQQQQAKPPAQQQQARPPAQQQPPRQTPQQSGSANEVEILVPGNKVGLVIGKGGETIKKLQDETGAKMWVVQDSRSAESTHKPLRIGGDPKKVAEARRRVMEIIGEEDQGTPPARGQQQRPQQGGPRSQQPQQSAPWSQQPQQGGPRPQQPQQAGAAPQQGGPGPQKPWPKSGGPAQQQQSATPARSGPPGFAPTPQAQPPQQEQRPSSEQSAAGVTQQMQQMNSGGPSRSTPPGFTPPQQPVQQKSPSPEKSASVVNLGLGARGRDYPALNGLLPPKRNDRPPMKKTGRVIIVETNHLGLSMKDRTKPVYHYDVKVEPEKPFRFYRPALRAIREVLYPNNWPSFDGKKNLYSAVKLPFRGDSATETVQVFDEERGQPKDVTVTITLAAEVSFSSIGQYFREGSSTRPPQDAIQALDVCLRQPAAQRFLQVGRSYFSQPRGRIVQLGDGLNLWYGFFQSAILGWRQPFLNIDVAHKGFPAAVNCIQALEEFVGGPLRGNDTINEHQATKMRGLIKGLKIIYEMPKSAQRRTHKVIDLGKSARETRFTVQDRGEMTVEQYFRETYDYTIRYPLIPCLKCGSVQREFSLPAELCRIMEGQIVLKKLNEIQTRTMVKEAATPAPHRRQKILDSMVNVRFEADPHIQEFGLTVSKEFKKVEARILNAPSVYYSNKRPIPVNKGVWMSSSFIRPGTLSNWVIYNCERRTRPNELDNLERELIKIGGTLGMSVNKAKIMNLRNDNVREVEKDFASFQRDKVQLLFVILPDRGYVTYAKIKSIAEIQVGVLTQCLKYITITRRLNPATVTNILLKVNAKINGINHNIVPEFWPTFLQRPVMVVGADVTHPSPDQQDIPSVAAVAASHDASAFHYNMKWRLQQPREEMIQDLENIMKEQLMFFYRKAGYKPEHILFYRDGVSEGQFKKVLDIELQAIRRACKSIGDNYEPPITFLVVQKRHHTRFFPTNPRDADGKNQNVPAGTIVDTEIVHPTEFDFYLVSHASIQGTSRPTKYHVLWDDAKMPEQLLEEITYYLCHLFTRCTRSVSYPAPTYYAHLAAFRIRSYIENQNIHLRNLPQEERNRTVKQEIVNNNPMFFV
uniref:Protein argonaute-2 n=2 Tax=Lygus hesperus TaxID=30085 RepID=A0A146M025_LYGHE